MSRSTHASLDALLFSHFERNKHRLGGSLESFSETLLEHYHALVPELHRAVKLSTEPNIAKRMEANGKRLRRYADERHDHQLPAALVPAFIAAIAALAPDAAVSAKADVCRQLGSLYVPIPEAGGGDLFKVSRLAREFGEALEALAPIMEDGSINADDAHHLRAADHQLDDLIAAATALKAQFHAVGTHATASVLFAAETAYGTAPSTVPTVKLTRGAH